MISTLCSVTVIEISNNTMTSVIVDVKHGSRYNNYCEVP